MWKFAEGLVMTPLRKDSSEEKRVNAKHAKHAK